MFIVVKCVQSFFSGTVRQGVGGYRGHRGYRGYRGNGGVSFVKGLDKCCPFGSRVDGVFALISPFFPIVQFFLVGFFLGEHAPENDKSVVTQICLSLWITCTEARRVLVIDVDIVLQNDPSGFSLNL